STLPNGFEAVATVAGPVGWLVTGSAHEALTVCAPTDELNGTATTNKPPATAIAADAATSLGMRRENITTSVEVTDGKFIGRSRGLGR
ncbi:MAG TPA: hypothetical protein VIX82_04740, partial [Solirubrobacteraceae bacterium]